MVHDCVIVPRFGGFVLREVSASWRANENLFCPMHREISFNTTLRYNDGLLTEAYMKAYKVDFQKACRMIEDDVDEIKNGLYRGVKVELGPIGFISLGKENQLIFRSTDSGYNSMGSYGLPSFQLKTVQALQREEAALLVAGRKAEKDNVFYIPVNRRWLQGIAGVAAAVALFLVISTPVKQVNTDAYTANFIPVEVIAAHKPAAVVATPAATIETPAPVVKKVVQQKPEEQPKPVLQSKDLFYVVVSSMNSAKQADAFISQMDRSVFKHVDKLVEAKKVRVYAAKFDNREKADTYMAKLRKNPKYKDAWVYIP